MKLQHKKSGVLGRLKCIRENGKSWFEVKTKDYTLYYYSLAQLNAEWKVYEEPKKHYSIKEFGRVYGLFDTEISCDSTLSDYREIGNRFETEEDAEKAVEKLKALTRLKDSGFKFTGWKLDKNRDKLIIEATDPTFRDDKDLDLLFGGKK